MQILVRDIFRLQSLQTAHLIAGREGILRPLCGGTILEMTELGRDNASELLSFSLKPQEIMITALYNVKNDVESQCDVIRAQQTECGRADCVLLRTRGAKIRSESA